jgi:hypothetical protein
MPVRRTGAIRSERVVRKLPFRHDGRRIAPGIPFMNQPKDVKERVREFLERRQTERRRNIHSPIPGPEQIRREIGWDQGERRRHDRRR